MRSTPELISLTLIVAVVVYITATLTLTLAQRRFMYFPAGELAEPAAGGLSRIEVVPLPMADGTVLTAWHAAPREGKPTVLYFHGNGGALSIRSTRFKEILDSGFGLLAASYRGYPGSGGSPSEAALVADGLALFDWLKARGAEIVLHGESLGTGVAVAVAAEREAEAVILEAPYTAAVDIAVEAFPWLPVSFLMRDQYRSRERIARVDEPLLIVHGTDDPVIPVTHAKRLYDLAREPKHLVIVEGGGHADLWERGLWQYALAFLQDRGA